MHERRLPEGGIHQLRNCRDRSDRDLDVRIGTIEANQFDHTKKDVIDPQHTQLHQARHSYPEWISGGSAAPPPCARSGWIHSSGQCFK